MFASHSWPPTTAVPVSLAWRRLIGQCLQALQSGDPQELGQFLPGFVGEFVLEFCVLLPLPFSFDYLKLVFVPSEEQHRSPRILHTRMLTRLDLNPQQFTCK